MSVPSYPFEQIDRQIIFTFRSVSDEKTIKKVIIYELFEPNEEIFNVALLDIDKNGQASDLSVSNNKDMEKVLSTVVQTFKVFFKKYPKGKLIFRGSNEVRTRLYRMAITKYVDFFEPIYEIYGFLSESSEPEKFVKNHSYIGFLIKIK